VRRHSDGLLGRATNDQRRTTNDQRPTTSVRPSSFVIRQYHPTNDQRRATNDERSSFVVRHSSFVILTQQQGLEPMTDIAIKVENLSKRYRIGLEEELPDTLVGALTQAVKRPFRNWRRLRRLTNFDEGPTTNDQRSSSVVRRSSSVRTDVDRDTLWALRDVSFEVKRGEVVGIIGRNGAGKSTLLKILARITHPTSGRVELHGRVGSLLEVGTGFHPELTGRENIYMNGTLLGMTKAEVDRKFDEIVDFSGVEKFIDTPVKRYSSGMRVRLAFSVAAHLNPEILLVDEVLAVGDTEFQKKCLGKMEDITRQSRTILFVSHNLSMIRRLCNRAVLLDKGQILAKGLSEKVVSEYTDYTSELTLEVDKISSVIANLPPDPAFRLLDVGIFQNGGSSNIVGNGKPIEIAIEYLVREETQGLRVFFDLLDQNDELIFRSFHDNGIESIPTVKPGHYISKAMIPANWLSPVTYHIEIKAGIHNVRMVIPTEIRIPLTVENTGTVNRAYVGDPIRGKLSPVIPWTTEEIR
jgi:lipopolysaccharide transport system ATP-binding protein